jgi:uncharacterized protein YxjI
VNAIENFIQSSQNFVIKQKKEWIEIFSGIETKNKYSVLDDQMSEIGFIVEEGRGFIHFIKRWFLRSHRPFNITVLDKEGHRILCLNRKFFWFFSDLNVTFDDKDYGSIHRRFSLFYKHYDVHDADGNFVFKVRSPFWRMWTFPVKNENGKEIGLVTKKWQGLLKEAFTDSDAFMIKANAGLSVESKILLFCCGISIDFDYFENNQGSGNLFDFVGN